MGLSARNVSLKVAGETWLDAVDLHLATGSFTVLLGPTGAGKTSLLRVLAGLSRPTTGQIEAGGKDVTGIDVRRRNIGFVYQEFVSYPHKSVFSNIASPLIELKLSRDDVRARVTEAARLVGLDRLLDRRPRELSGGQQQRIAIGRAIVRERQLVCLDEPLVNLDYKLREHLRFEFRELFTRMGTTVIYASSEAHEALDLGGDVILMNEGRVLQQGPALSVFDRPVTTEAARIISDPPMSILPVIGRDGGWWLGRTRIGASRRTGPYRLGFYPHRIGPHIEGDDRLTIEVEFAETTGAHSFVYSHIDTEPVAIKIPGIHPARIGETLSIGFQIEDAKLFSSGGMLIEGGDAHG